MHFNANLNNTNVFYFCMVAVNVISFKKPEFLEKARADERHCQTLSHNDLSSTPCHTV